MIITQFCPNDNKSVEYSGLDLLAILNTPKGEERDAVIAKLTASLFHELPTCVTCARQMSWPNFVSRYIPRTLARMEETDRVERHLANFARQVAVTVAV